MKDKIYNIREGQLLKSPLFNGTVRLVKIISESSQTIEIGVFEIDTHFYSQITLRQEELSFIEVITPLEGFCGNAELIRLGIQSLILGIAYEYDPYFGLSISRVDPLPHQLEAVYDYLLKLARVRFLLADDAGAGKTIMAGLLIRELKLRKMADRILIVCPANLTFQWQRELKEKFEEKFLILKGQDIREQFGINQWLDNNQILTSLDLAKRFEILPGLKQVHWDLVIVDEAHRMSWSPPSGKTARYALGELLRDSSDHLLLLTATPHKGDPANFALFLQLLDNDAFADVKSIREAMGRQRAPFYLRRTKEAMVFFPEKTQEGTWTAKKIFTKRITNTVDFKIDGSEFELYRDVTNYVKKQSAKAAARGDDPRARAVGFLMALYQRRLASSAYALQHSLENRARRLDEALKQAKELLHTTTIDIPSPEEIEEMDDNERDRFERLIEAQTIAENAQEVQTEIRDLRQFAEQARIVEETVAEAKLSRLKALLEEEGFFSDRQQRLLIFTEFKDTLDYLVDKLQSWGFLVGFIHGGMKSGSRNDPNTRLYTEQQFKEGAIQILVATEAAGEGINLQCCNILFNYDIPWNPNRLEQRMGRIHRYGQIKDCLIFNFVATNTIEGQVLQRLLEKLQEIRNALDNDAVFNVVGELLPTNHLEKILRDYYSGKLGDNDLEERFLHNIDEQHFRDICQSALEGLATKKLNLEMLVERRALAKEHRVVPETIARFMREAASYANLEFKIVAQYPHTFDVGKTPLTLKRYESEPDWKLPELAYKYPRCSTDRDIAEMQKYEWVTPGHPLFEAIRKHTSNISQKEFADGACFYSVQQEVPSRLDLYRAKIVDGTGQIIHERLFIVEVSENAEPHFWEPNAINDLLPAETPKTLPDVIYLPEAKEFLQNRALFPFLEEIRAERITEIKRIEEHIGWSLTELLQKADEEIGKASIAITQKQQGAEGRLAQAETRHSELMARRENRRKELEKQRSLTLQEVEKITSLLILPHPDRNTAEVQNLKCNKETEAVAMKAVIDYEKAQERQVYDVHEKNLGYDITSLDLNSGDLRLIEVKGLGAETGTIFLTPNERRVAEDRRDCYWLYVVTNCAAKPTLQEPIKDPVRFPWNEVSKIQHYYLSTENVFTNK